jgi:hypothetical protein
MEKALAWLDSYNKVSAQLERVLGGHASVDEMLKANGGLIKLRNVFPQSVADGILSLLDKRRDWIRTDADEDYQQNNIEHSFLSVRKGPQLESVYRALALLRPGELHSFSAAKYQSSHHIAPHDDKAFTNCKMDDGSIQSCSRDIAVIYYLTKNWKEEYGGLLLDLEGNKTYIPEYNSAVVFSVPRFHQVTRVLTTRPRYSIFGWWLVPFEKYKLSLTPGLIEDKEVDEEEDPRRRKTLKRKAPPVSYSVLGHSVDQKLFAMRKERDASRKR